MKKRVFEVFSLLIILTGVLMFLQIVAYGGITGYVSYDLIGETNSGFRELNVIGLGDDLGSFERGERYSFFVDVKNSGSEVLRDCGIDLDSNWFSSSDRKGLSVGEEYSFFVELKIPEESGNGKHVFDLRVNCEGYVLERELSLDVGGDSFKALIESYRKVDSGLRIEYSLEDLIGEGRAVEYDYGLQDRLGNIVFEGEGEVFIGDHEKGEYVLLVYPEESHKFEGEYLLRMKFDDGFEVREKSKEIVFASKGINSFAIKSEDFDKLSPMGVFFIIGVVALLIVKMIYGKLSRKSKIDRHAFDRRKERKTIELDFS